MSTNYGFEPTLDGLNNIDADNTTTSDIVCNTIQILNSGTAPTMPSGNNSINIATTAFVTAAISGSAITNYVTTDTTQTLTTGIKTFTNLPECSVVPTTGNQLTNKTYVDSVVGGGSLLALNNTWTGTNNFKDVVYINNPAATKTLILKSTNQNITMSTGTSNSGISGVSFNCNTVTVPADNTENTITVTIPFDIGTFGGPLIYPAGTVTITYTSFSINILKNGASYSGSSPSATFYNYDTFINSWSIPLGTAKLPIFTSLLGNILIPMTLDIGNTSTDTYTIFLTVNGTAVHSSGSPYLMDLYALTTGNTNFTTTNFANTASAVFLSTNPTYIAYGKLLGDNGIYLSANNTLNIQSSSTIEFLTNTNFNTVLPQSTLTPLNNADLATKLYIDNAISQAITALTPSTNPIGTIIMRASSTVPSGYLYCDGTTYNTTAYAGLWSIIFYTYGGSGSNFRVPDYRSSFIRGFGSSTVGGVTYTAPALGTVQQDMALTTPVSGYSTPLSSTGFRSCGSGVRDCIARTSQGDPIENPTGLNLAYPSGRGGTEVRPINQSIYYYIKY